MYRALYRKWRPKTFNDIVGQEHISETLKNQIVTGRLSHAYLFVGTRGTGKTTCAKILSRAVNCTNPQDGNPCNKCPACLGIENGSILDVLELDAASNNGVDNVRALREEAVFTPVDVKKRVYIIDEVHMLSTPAFNALLKILEEPPEHLIFILATTEIYKVPATILSRCQRFTFKRILPEKIAERLLYVAGQEKLNLTSDAARLLARLSDGSLRDALSLLDQCASDEVIDYNRVLSAIGLAENDEIAGILASVAEGDISGALTILDKLYMAGKVMASVIEALMNLVRDILVISLMPDGGSGLLSGGFERAVLEDFKKRLSNPQLLNIMTVLRETMLDISKGGNGKLSAELCLMRLCERTPSGDLSSVLDRIAALEEQLSGRYTPPRETQQAQAQAANTPRFEPRPIITKEPVPDKTEQAASSGTSQYNEPPAALPQEKDPNITPPASSTQPKKVSGDAWNDILKLVKAKIDGPQFMILSDPAQATASIDGSTVTIRVKNDFPEKIINVPPVTSAVKDAAGIILNSPAIVRVMKDDGNKNGSIDKLESALKRFPGVLQVEE